MGNIAGGVIGLAAAGPAGFVAGGIIGFVIEAHKMHESGGKVVSPMRLRKKEVSAVIEGEDFNVHIEGYIPQCLRDIGCTDLKRTTINSRLIVMSGTIASQNADERDTYLTSGKYFWAQVVDMGDASSGLSVGIRAIKYCIVLIDYEVEGAVVYCETYRPLIFNKHEIIKLQGSLTAQMIQELEETAKSRVTVHF